ncbi:Metal transporter Nramp1 [Echinococcus multilocularis]|uniref:Metal transporter Nramp1 n=1 Tax=Echinococcus multilocularis TaxID=6211 RepID=A0A0S4MIP6_ECHMU|nr:Metal transporter Nramp1 [Echinococcus multilocularis]
MLNSLVRVSRRVRWLVYHRTTDYPTPGTPCTRGNAKPPTVTRDDGPPASPHSAGNTAATPHADQQPRAPLHCTCDVRAGYPYRSCIRGDERTSERMRRIKPMPCTVTYTTAARQATNSAVTAQQTTAAR